MHAEELHLHEGLEQFACCVQGKGHCRLRVCIVNVVSVGVRESMCVSALVGGWLSRLHGLYNCGSFGQLLARPRQ